MIIAISGAELYPNFIWLRVMRFFFGVAVGFAMGSAPKILIEAVPAHVLDYGFGSSTNMFTFLAVAILLTLSFLNGNW